MVPDSVLALVGRVPVLEGAGVEDPVVGQVGVQKVSNVEFLRERKSRQLKWGVHKRRSGDTSKHTPTHPHTKTERRKKDGRQLRWDACKKNSVWMRVYWNMAEEARWARLVFHRPPDQGKLRAWATTWREKTVQATSRE